MYDITSHMSTIRGMSAASAELIYIKLAQQLPEYGHEALQTLVRNKELI